ncbi:hypothetical protein CVT24_001309 [Panaeolus cyanescens]|uniref:N-acetyltransferase domain-containing protein n=1 Tax=Panaeolus cyanescens TaxID=181874 RepID=A0A409YZ89_9AGAR|nr:hypothetical protein CVT24_001309 [Panaeolus cyanescens]
MDSDGITLRSLQNEDLPALRTFVINTFGRKEPISVFLNTSLDAFTAYYDAFSHLCDMPTSMIACTSSNEIVSCFLTTPLDMTPNSLQRLHKIVAKLATGPFAEDLAGYLALDAFMLDHYLRDKSIIDQRGLIITFCATADGFEGKRLMRRLCCQSLLRAKELGWNFFTVDCTNPATHYLSRGLKFQDKAEIPFAELVWDGRKPLLGMKGSVLVTQKDLRTFDMSEVVWLQSVGRRTPNSEFPPYAKL